jgi:Tfp pilus assembly protein PilF
MGHSETRKAAIMLADMLLQQNDTERAAEVLECVVLDVRASTGLPNTVETMKCFELYAKTVAELKKPENASLAFSEAFKCAKDKLGLDHAVTHSIAFNYGCFLKSLGLKEVDQAVYVMDIAVQGYSRTVGAKHPSYKAAFKKLEEMKKIQFLKSQDEIV